MKKKYSKENIEAIKKAIQKYREVTLEEIILEHKEDKTLWMEDIARGLTGFGNKGICEVCISVNENCGNCFSNTFSTHAHRCTNKSWEKIKDAKSIARLKEAFEKRADFLKEKLEEAGYLK